MFSFHNLIITVALAAFVSATPGAEIYARQLGDIPSSVCLTGGILPVPLPSGVSVVECSAGETCTPIAGISVLPIGVGAR